jgi:hypothetical protein
VFRHVLQDRFLSGTHRSNSPTEGYSFVEKVECRLKVVCRRATPLAALSIKPQAGRQQSIWSDFTPHDCNPKLSANGRTNCHCARPFPSLNGRIRFISENRPATLRANSLRDKPSRKCSLASSSWNRFLFPVRRAVQSRVLDVWRACNFASIASDLVSSRITFFGLPHSNPVGVLNPGW